VELARPKADWEEWRGLPGLWDLLKFPLVTSEAMGIEDVRPSNPHSMELHLSCQAWELNLETLGRS
jgi:hypothetical protein